MNNRDNPYKHKPEKPRTVTEQLHDAVRVGNVEDVEVLLKNGADVNGKTVEGETPLHLAIVAIGSLFPPSKRDKVKMLKIIKMLLDQNADFKIPDSRERTPLALAAAIPWNEVIDELLQRGADPTLGLQKNINPATYPNVSYNYNKQVVINYLTQIHNPEEGLEYKWKKNHPPSTQHMIKGEDFSKGTYQVPLDKNDVIRVYILLHGFRGSDFGITGYGYDDMDDLRISYREIAEHLVNLIGDHQAVINLVSCEAGAGTRNDGGNLGHIDERSGLSFAAKLHQEIATKMTEKQINRTPPDVIARLIPLGTEGPRIKSQAGKKMTEPFSKSEEDRVDELLRFERKNDRIHQQPGSKVIYTTDGEGNQIKLDAYSYAWKAKVLNEITTLINTTQLKAKKNFLSDWKNKMNRMSPQEVYKMIQDELSKPDSVLNDHSSLKISPARLFRANTSKQMNILLDQGKRFFDAKETIHTPIETGRKIGPKKQD